MRLIYVENAICFWFLYIYDYLIIYAQDSFGVNDWKVNILLYKNVKGGNKVDDNQLLVFTTDEQTYLIQCNKCLLSSYYMWDDVLDVIRNAKMNKLSCGIEQRRKVWSTRDCNCRYNIREKQCAIYCRTYRFLSSTPRLSNSVSLKVGPKNLYF